MKPLLLIAVFAVSAAWASLSPEAIDARDLEIGPWLNLHDGGQAVGVAQGKPGVTPGVLEHGTLLPETSPGLSSYKNPAARWGTGHMISLLTSSAADFHNHHPEITLIVGAIAQEHGGTFPPHSSHQNGLDADVLFVGTTQYASVLDGGVVSARFNPELNWEYWRSLTAQKIMRDDQPIPIVAAILVAPEIKTYLCTWARSTGRMTTPEDIDLLKRLRPTEDHDTHFHLRLQCSPYHAACVQPWDPGRSSGTGCN